ncbi:MAG: restriction endonuclease subunit M [Prevotella sp.]|nr:restriction endonuclease subunit M [Prevotella sp.]
MITKKNIGNVLLSHYFRFKENSGVYTKEYKDGDSSFSLKYNINTGDFTYPNGVKTDRNTTTDSHQNESFVVFLCIAQMFELGYKPHHFKLEGVNYSGTDKGYCDILVKDNDDVEYLIIECKTAELTDKDDQFRKHWAKTMNNGSQLFQYFNTFRRARYLCMYAADYIKYEKETGETDYKFENIYNIISLEDNEAQLKIDPSFQSFKQLRAEQGTSEDFFKVWKTTYIRDFSNRGLLETGIEPFKIGIKKYNIDDLHKIDTYSLNKKYNDFANILRKHTVSSHENAFDKLINLFIAKIIDEIDNREELKLQWKGASYDDYYSLQDRLNVLYREGMSRFFNDTVTFVETSQIDDAFDFLKYKADEGKRTIHKLFRSLKYYSNNPFAFLDVHNESLFYQNSSILKDVILMLQDIYITANEDNQFLGDLFEGFLNKGVHQSEGQFFTPLPIVRFLISSLPLNQVYSDENLMPKAIDYACGAGHFLTEYARQIRPILLEPHNQDLSKIKDIDERNEKIANIMHRYYEKIIGIEKDYRLSKVSQVAAYMYNMGGIRIVYGDALKDNPYIAHNSFDVLVANPPYSVRGFLDVLSEEERKKYSLSKYVTNTEKNGAIEVFFLEKASQLLKDEGVAAIILPVSILTKGNLFMYSLVSTKIC